MRIRNRKVILMLLPIAILLWTIGWGLFWAGSRNEPQEPKPAAEADNHITTGLLLEEPEEPNP